MSKHVTLNAQKRTTSGTAAARRSRREGLIPGVIYGAKQDEYPIQVDAKKFGEILRASASENFLVDLKIEGAKEAQKLALIQEVQHHPINGQILHIDFNAVREDTEIHANVPLTLTGDAPGVKAGGVIEQQHHEIEVHCLPTNLPETLSADISGLELNDTLQISDLHFPDGVTPTLEGDIIVVLVSEPRVSAADAAADAALDASSADEAEAPATAEEETK
jgi:large subunit ribosomal protein L25